MSLAYIHTASISPVLLTTQCRWVAALLRPMLEDTATGKRVAGGVNSALMSYGQLRGDVLSAHDKTHSVIGNLRKAVPEINL